MRTVHLARIESDGVRGHLCQKSPRRKNATGAWVKRLMFAN